METMTGEMVVCALEQIAGNRNDELKPVLLHHGKAAHNIGQYQGSTQISLFASHLESKLRSLRNAVCISLTPSVCCKNLDFCVAMTNESAVNTHLTQRRMILQ